MSINLVPVCSSDSDPTGLGENAGSETLIAFCAN